MRQLLCYALVAFLAVSSISASAQDMIDKADLSDPKTSIDQAPISVGDIAGQTEQQQIRSRISNTSSASTDEIAEQLRRESAGQAAKRAQRETPEQMSEFQRFVQNSTGKPVPVFGAQFFQSGRSDFAPLPNSPVVADYPLGPGDEILIRGWGTIDIDYRAIIDRDGVITIPTIGSMSLSGVRASQAESVVRAAVNRLYKGVTLNVSFGRLRSITVYVVGQASAPGTYTMSSTSTLVTAMFASGGPNASGSMRHVQLKRNGKVVADIDLYAFIARGDKSADMRLLDGDTIYIPPASGHVALVGTVNNPAIYELKSEKETVASLLDIAGGMPVLTDPRRVFLERIEPSRAKPRSVVEFALDARGLQRTLKDGDVLSLLSITPDFSNAVVLRGNVDQPIRAPFKPGMRVSDLIPSRDYLMTRASLAMQNDTILAREKDGPVAARIGNLLSEINWDYAVVERINRNDLSVSLHPFNLGNVFANPAGPDNLALQPGDTVTTFSQDDVAVPMNKRRVFVRVEGEVNAPGVYQMSGSETLQTLLARAGGPTDSAYLFGTAFYREQVRKEQQANLEKAARRLESQLRNEQTRAGANVLNAQEAGAAQARRESEMAAAREAIARVRDLRPTGRIAFNLDPRERSFSRLPQLKLENGDRLVIPPKVDFVHVFGAVNTEASPIWRPNGRVNDYLKQVGMTANADEDNIFILRVDGSVISRNSSGWGFGGFGGFGGVLVMPGDSIVVPEKFDRESAWTKFTQGTREWAQIFANFGLGAAAIKTLRD